jgi:hypothetical protein
MVRRNDNHGINIIPGKKLTIVVISSATLISSACMFRGISFLDAALAVFTPYTIHVAYGQHLNFIVAYQPVQMAATHTSFAD